jgi:transmembrane sensor
VNKQGDAVAAKQRIPDHIEKEATRWVVERDAGLTTDGECALQAWLTADPLHAMAFTKAEKVWRAMGSFPVKAEVNKRRTRGIARSDGYPSLGRPHRSWIPPALAASLALAFICIAQDGPTRLRADAMTETGERRDVPLADGSVIQLNTASAISIDYRSDRRVVRLLKGEAAFTVAPNRARPFTVESGKGTTTALGTRFIVRRDGGNTEVAVTEHRVRVGWSIGGASNRVDLGEGQAMRYGPDGVVRPHMVDTGAVASWTRGRLVFVDRPLGEVVAELNRYHPGYIRIMGDDLAMRRVSGVFRTDDPMAALDTLQRLLGISSTRLTDRLIFLHG